MRKLLKLFGAGVLSGAGYKLGCMMADALFPKGIGGFLSRFNKPKEEENNKSSNNRNNLFLKVWQGD